jgi:hypothetical protein
MKTQLITYSDPKSLADGVKLFPVVADSGKFSEHKQSSEDGPHFTVEEIRLRADTVSPLLQEMLDNRPPEHWGIND